MVLSIEVVVDNVLDMSLKVNVVEMVAYSKSVMSDVEFASIWSSCCIDEYEYVFLTNYGCGCCLCNYRLCQNGID